MIPLILDRPKLFVPFSDAFARADGALSGYGWIYNAGIWQISGGAAVGTPTLGAELVTDGALEDWASATNLTGWSEDLAGTSTVNREATTIHGGTYAARLDVDASNSLAQISQGVGVLGTWYQLSAWARADSGTPTIALGNGTVGFPAQPLNTTYTQYFQTWRNTDTTGILVRRITATGRSIYLDDISKSALTLSSLFATILFSSADVTIQDAVTRAAGCQAGVVLNLDNPTSPANFVIGYLDGAGNAKLDKCVAGTYTNVITGAVTYVAGQLVKVIKSGTSYSLWYNGVQIGTMQTISDASIVSNRYHGMFSTNSGNSLDTFSVTR